MGWLLLTNDDGSESPALSPFADALGASYDVRVAVPNGERSWSSKAITRFGELTVDPLLPPLDGLAHSGSPADGVHLGTHILGDTSPALVVSGINIGFNHGAAYVWSSGTVGAVVEAWTQGLPGVAFSTGTMGDWEAWKSTVLSPDAADRWRQLAALSASILQEVLSEGLHLSADLVNINLPFDADDTTERRRTTVARTGYGGLFQQQGNGSWVHTYDGTLTEFGDLRGTDVEAARDGVISITPLCMPGSPGSSTS